MTPYYEPIKAFSKDNKGKSLKQIVAFNHIFPIIQKREAYTSKGLHTRALIFYRR